MNFSMLLTNFQEKGHFFVFSSGWQIPHWLSSLCSLKCFWQAHENWAIFRKLEGILKLEIFLSHHVQRIFTSLFSNFISQSSAFFARCVKSINSQCSLFADVNKSSNRECDNESCKSTSKQCIDTSWWEFISLLDLMNFIFDEWILKERIFLRSRVWKYLDFYVKMVKIWRKFHQKLDKNQHFVKKILKLAEI